MSDQDDRKSSNLLSNDMQQIKNYIEKDLINNKHVFTSILFIDDVADDEHLNKIIKDNSLLMDHKQKCYSSNLHASSNLCVPCVFPASIVHSSIPPMSGIRASLQVQFEIDNNRGVEYPTTPRCDVYPMCHDFKNPIFLHVMEMVQESMKKRLLGHDEVSNFAANNCNNDWYIFDSQDGNKKFFNKLKDSALYLKQKKKFDGTFADWLLTYWNLKDHNVKDVRIIFIGGNLCTGPHTDTGHLRSSNKSVTLHVNAWTSSDYIPGNTSSGPWLEYSYDVNWWNTDGFISGKFGELDCWHDKSKYKFIFGTELERTKKKITINAFSKKPTDGFIKKIKRANDTSEEPTIKVVKCEHKKMMRKKGKSEKQGHNMHCVVCFSYLP